MDPSVVFIFTSSNNEYVAQSYITVKCSFLYWREGWFLSRQKIRICPGDQHIRICGEWVELDLSRHPGFPIQCIQPMFVPKALPHQIPGILLKESPYSSQVECLFLNVRSASWLWLPWMPTGKKNLVCLLLLWTALDVLNTSLECGQAYLNAWLLLVLLPHSSWIRCFRASAF